MRKIASLSLVVTLVLFSLGFKACSKSQVQAACDDIAEGFRLSSIKFPADKILRELNTDAKTICDTLRAGGKVKELIKAFLPRFDSFVNAHGQSEGLALIDIGIHIILNHLVSSPSAQAAIDGVLVEYSLRPTWGCEFRPDKCH